jgi:WD40 repeat protein
MINTWMKTTALMLLLVSLASVWMTLPIAKTLGRQADAATPVKVPPGLPPAGKADLHGDPLPSGAVARMGTLRLYHGAYEVAYSADGKFLVSSSTGDIQIWDAANGRELHRIEVGYGARHIALSPDGSWLAAGGPESVCIWDMASGKELHRFAAHDQTRYPKEVFGVAFSPDGKLLATVGLGGKFVIWDAVLGKQRLVLPPLKNHYCHLAFSRDGRTLISGELNRSVSREQNIIEQNLTRLWEVASGKERQQLPGQQFIALSPDGQTLAMTSNYGRTLQLVQLGTWKTLLTMKDFPGNPGDVGAFAFAPDGNSLAIGCRDDPAVRLWDAHTGKAIRTIPMPGYVFSVAFAPDGKTLAVGFPWAGGDYNRIRLFDPATGAERPLQPWHLGSIRQVRFLPDGKTLASIGADNTFRLWRAADGKSIHTLALGKMPLAMSQDGSLVAACREGLNRPAWEETVELWDTNTGKIRYRLPGNQGSVSQAVFSPDGTTLAVTVGTRAGVYFWDVQTGKLRNSWVEPGDNVHARVRDLAFSPDGKIVATGHEGCKVLLREVGSGRLIRELGTASHVPGQSEWATGCFDIAFAPDGKSITAMAASENRICVWEVASGRETCSFKPPAPPRNNVSEDWLWWLAYSPDGKKLLSAGNDGVIRFWDPASGKELRTLSGHAGFVSTLAFSKDGARLASGSQDCTVLIWDMTGRRGDGLPAREPALKNLP